MLICNSTCHWIFNKSMRLVLILPLVLALVVMVTSVRAFFQPRKHSVFSCYYMSGLHWTERQSLYDKADMGNGIDVFRYHPSFAVLMVPFCHLPENVAGMVWRIIGGCCLGFVMMAALKAESKSVSAGLLTVAGIPWIVCSLTSLNNGQLNVELMAAVAGATLLAMRQKSIGCGVLLGIAIVLKIFPIAYLGLFALVMPWGMIIAAICAICGFLVLPFITAPSDYALREYQSWVSFLSVDDRSFYSLKDGYRDLWMLWRLSGLPTHRPTYQLIQVLGGLILCLPVVWAHGRLNQRSLCRLIFGLSTGWILLLGPSSESSTYILLGPWLFWTIVESYKIRRDIRDYCLWGSIVCLVLSATGGLFKSAAEWHALGWHPAAAMFLVAWELIGLTRYDPAIEQAEEIKQGSLR
jgi:hypothetical protein